MAVPQQHEAIRLVVPSDPQVVERLRGQLQKLRSEGVVHWLVSRLANPVPDAGPLDLKAIGGGAHEIRGTNQSGPAPRVYGTLVGRNLVISGVEAKTYQEADPNLVADARGLAGEIRTQSDVDSQCHAACFQPVVKNGRLTREVGLWVDDLTVGQAVERAEHVQEVETTFNNDFAARAALQSEIDSAFKVFKNAGEQVAELQTWSLGERDSGWADLCRSANTEQMHAIGELGRLAVNGVEVPGAGTARLEAFAEAFGANGGVAMIERDYRLAGTALAFQLEKGIDTQTVLGTGDDGLSNPDQQRQLTLASRVLDFQSKNGIEPARGMSGQLGWNTAHSLVRSQQVSQEVSL